MFWGAAERDMKGARPSIIEREAARALVSASVSGRSPVVVDQLHGGAGSVLVVLLGLAFGSPSAGVRTMSALDAMHGQYDEPVAVRHLLAS